MAAIALSALFHKYDSVCREAAPFRAVRVNKWFLDTCAKLRNGVLSGQLALVLLFAPSLSAQQSRAVREQVGHVASALSAQHPEEAMDAFDKSFDGYSRLHDYFVGLTDGYSIVNEMVINDEQIVDREATLTIHWVLPLSDLASGLTQNRDEELTVKLSKKKHDWRIVDISPLEFFNPEQRKSK